MKRKQHLREKQRRQHAYLIARRKARQYPQITVESTGAPEEFIELVRRVVAQFDFGALDGVWQLVFRIQRTEGIGEAIRRLREMLELDKLPAFKKDWREYCFTWLASELGSQIVNRIPESRRFEFMPVSCFTLAHSRLPGHHWRIGFSSLKRVQTRDGIAYFSPHRPRVNLAGRRRIVAFFQHAIMQMGAERSGQDGRKHRLIHGWPHYQSIANLHALLYCAALFDPITLFDPKNVQPRTLAFSIFDACANPGCFNWRYVTEVLQSAGTENHFYYYRLGYCPAVIDGDYAIAKTLLLPGFKGTPEYERLRASHLPGAEKRRLLQSAIRDERPRMVESGHSLDFLRTFHELGIPQVVECGRSMFNDHPWH